MNEHESKLPPFVVVSFERPEGERFAIFRGNEWPRSTSPIQGRPPATPAAAVEQFVQSLELLTEESLRKQLAHMGLAEESVTVYIAHARRVREMNKGGSWEVVTTLGYRNIEGQEVVAKTARTSTEIGQRVYVMRCGVCGHTYGTYGSEIPHRLCPNCQDGPPGLPS